MTKLFEGDNSPHRVRGARHTVLSEADLEQEQRLYESELRLACRMRGKGGELLQAQLFEPLVEIKAATGSGAETSSVRDAIEAARFGKPLALFDSGSRTVLLRLLQAAGVARCIDGVAAPLVPLVVPNPNPNSLTLTLTPTLTP